MGQGEQNGDCNWFSVISSFRYELNVIISVSLYYRTPSEVKEYYEGDYVNWFFKRIIDEGPEHDVRRWSPKETMSLFLIKISRVYWICP